MYVPRAAILPRITVEEEQWVRCKVPHLDNAIMVNAGRVGEQPGDERQPLAFSWQVSQKRLSDFTHPSMHIRS